MEGAGQRVEATSGAQVSSDGDLARTRHGYDVSIDDVSNIQACWETKGLQLSSSPVRPRSHEVSPGRAPPRRQHHPTHPTHASLGLQWPGPGIRRQRSSYPDKNAVGVEEPSWEGRTAGAGLPVSTPPRMEFPRDTASPQQTGKILRGEKVTSHATQ